MNSDLPDPADRPLPARVVRLGDEPGDDLSDVTTAEERLAILRELTVRAWRLTGRPVPTYRRDEIPVRVTTRG